jgi:rhodanese-related sulfurtransferase
MDSGDVFAIFDIRERGEYNEGQIYKASSLPRSQIEFRITDLVPSRNIPVIVYDEGGERANLAAETIEQLGYQIVYVLEGGLPAWAAAGFSVVEGVNVLSKEFGEKVYVESHVPDITPEELSARLARRDKIVVFDVRTPEEHQRFCIPGAYSVPGGDLILWAEELQQKSDTTYLMHCAGRTRSVISTETLRRLGLSNVYALRNGTMGWVLAGLELERNSGREAPSASPSSRAAGETLGSRIAQEEGVPVISVSELLKLRKAEDRPVVYLVDVRSPAEYERGHIPGSIGIPGGQAVQRADDFIAVRNAKIVFVSDGQARAVMAAYWYKQMGFENVAVLQGGIQGWIKNGHGLSTEIPAAENVLLDEARATAWTIRSPELASILATSNPLVLHVGSSLDFEKGHVPKSLWVSRGWLEIKIGDLCPDKSRTIILTCPDGRQSVLAARSLRGLGFGEVSVLDGGLSSWSREGCPTEGGLEGKCAVEPKDVVVPASASGNKQAMIRYLEWEHAMGDKFKGRTL